MTNPNCTSTAQVSPVTDISTTVRQGRRGDHLSMSMRFLLRPAISSGHPSQYVSACDLRSNPAPLCFQTSVLPTKPQQQIEFLTVHCIP